MKGFFLFLLITVSFSVNAQKMVLMEKLTSPFCGECGNAALTLEDITSDIPNVIWVSHHKPVGWIENPLMNDQSSALWNEISVFGTPLGMVNRQTDSSNSLFYGRGSWRAEIEKQLSEPAIVNMEVQDASFDWATNSIDFTVNVNLEEALSDGAYRLTALILEDSVGGVRQHNYYNAVAGHPHEGLGEIIWEYTHRNVTRAILDDHWGSADVIPDSPAVGTYSKTYSYTIPGGYNRNQMSIVCFVSKHDASNLRNRPVLNAAKFDFSNIGLGLTNVVDVDIDLSVNVFPNPASEVLNIETETVADKITLFDIQGKMVFELVPNSNASTISTNQFPRGKYLVVIDSKDKTSNQIVILK